MCGGGWTLTALFFCLTAEALYYSTILQKFGCNFHSYVVGKRVGGQKMSNAICNLLCGNHRLHFHFV